MLFFYSFLLISSVLSFVIDFKFYLLMCSVVLFLLAFFVFLGYLALWSVLILCFLFQLCFQVLLEVHLFFNFNLEF